MDKDTPPTPETDPETIWDNTLDPNNNSTWNWIGTQK